MIKAPTHSPLLRGAAKLVPLPAEIESLISQSVARIKGSVDEGALKEILVRSDTFPRAGLLESLRDIAGKSWGRTSSLENQSRTDQARVLVMQAVSEVIMVAKRKGRYEEPPQQEEPAAAEMRLRTEALLRHYLKTEDETVIRFWLSQIFVIAAGLKNVVLPEEIDAVSQNQSSRAGAKGIS